MADDKFPARRFSSAGATKPEVEKMRNAFENSDIGVQESMLEHFRPLSTNGLREYLASWRLVNSAVQSDAVSEVADESALEGDSEAADSDLGNDADEAEESQFDADLMGVGDSEPTE